MTTLTDPLRSSPGADAPRARPLGPLDLAVFAALWVPYALLVRRFWFVTDDAYISFRYARNWAAGHGLRFNLGEPAPVEGYSNFLWVALCALFEKLGLSVERWPPLVSAACGSVLMWLIFATLRRRLGIGLPIAAVATLIWALHPPVAVYSTSGLETMPFLLALFVAFERLILRRGGIAPLGAGLAALLLALLRVEGLYWALLLFALAAVSRAMARESFVKPLLSALGILVVGYGAYFAWRYAYYGLPLPNTAYAKAGMSAERLARGCDYVMAQTLTELTPLLAIPASLAVFRRQRRAIGLPLVAMSFAFPAYAILVSGDFMTFGRFLVPGWAFTTLLLAWMLSDIADSSTRRQAFALAPALVIGAAIAVIGLLSAFDLHLVPRGVRQRFHFRHNLGEPQYRSEFAQWEFQRDNALEWGVLGRALKRWLPPGAQVVRGAFGAMAYYSDLFVLDRSGLVNHEVAMLPAGERELNSPGHDKSADIEYFLERDPEVVRAKVLAVPRGGGLSEQDARGEFCSSLSAFGRQLRGPPHELADRYVVDFKPIPDGEYGGPGQFLVMWRRIPDGVDPAAAWREFEARAERFRNGIDEAGANTETEHPRPPKSGR